MILKGQNKHMLKSFFTCFLIIIIVSANAYSQVGLGDTPCTAPLAQFVTGNCSSNTQTQFRSNNISSTFTEFLASNSNCAEIEDNIDGWIKFIPPSNVVGIRLFDRGVSHSFYFYKETSSENCPINEPTLEYLFCEAGSPQQFETTTLYVEVGEVYYIKVRKNGSGDYFQFDACFLDWSVYNNCGTINNPSCNTDGPFQDFDDAISFPQYTSCNNLSPSLCNPVCEVLTGNIFAGLEGNMLYEACGTLTSSQNGTAGLAGYFMANNSCSTDNTDKTKNIRRSFNYILFDDDNNPIYSKIKIDSQLGGGWEWSNLTPNKTYKYCCYATVANTTCLLLGTCTRFYYPEPTFDCPVLMLNIGDNCDDGDPNTSNDTVNANCMCEGQTIYDCPALMLNIGDPCDDEDTDTTNDTVNANCMCEGQTTFDCPALMLNIGDTCDDGDPNTNNDTVIANCMCEGQSTFDCPALMLNIGDPCDDGNTDTTNDTVNANCMCEGQPTFDCPALMLNIGDACDDGDPTTSNDTVNANCTCEGQTTYDCPALMLNIGDPCDDGDSNTTSDTVNANCMCEGQSTFDCPALMLNIGDPCDDGDSDTTNDTVNANCMCEGQSTFDCPALMLNIGDTCDDGDPNTNNDTLNANCMCEGQSTFDCPALMLNIGDPCDDDNPNTINDLISPSCICIGDLKTNIPYYIPTLISINQVEANCFTVFFGNEHPSIFLLQVYDRWGNLIYNSTDSTECWKGHNNGISVLPGVYVYKATIDDDIISGNITILD